MGSPLDIKHTPGGSTNPNLNSNKPRIWSLADMASKEEKESSDSKQQHQQHQPQPQHHHSPLGIYQSGPGKILSPLASRMPYPPYLKHEMTKPDIYRNFSGPPGSHMPVGHPDYALLESYQRALVAHNGLAASMHPLTSMMSKSAAEANVPFAPLSLTTSHNNNNNNTVPSSGASPSASSTSSRPENTTPLSSMPPSAHERQPQPPDNGITMNTP